MKRFFIITLAISFLVALVSAQEPATDRFEKVVNRMVKAINEGDYAEIQKDFGKVMLDAFPLEKSKIFFGNLSTQYGKIQKLDPAQLTPPNQAIFPAHFERGILNIRVILDNQDKIIGLWFLPHTPSEPVADVNAVADVNVAAEPNAPKAEWLKELEGALERLKHESEKEIHAWLRGAIENKARLAEAVQEQVTMELNFIREFAVEEGAVKTTEAVDRLLAGRNERFEEITKRMEEEKRRELLREREERKGRDREQRRRDREDRRTRERPSRRTGSD